MKIKLDDLRVKYEAPMKMCCDNKSAIRIAHNLIQRDRTKPTYENDIGVLFQGKLSI